MMFLTLLGAFVINREDTPLYVIYRSQASLKGSEVLLIRVLIRSKLPS